MGNNKSTLFPFSANASQILETCMLLAPEPKSSGLPTYNIFTHIYY